MLLDFEKPLVELEKRIQQIRDIAEDTDVDVSDEIRQLEDRATELRQEIFSNLSPAQRLQLARHPRRPSTLDYIFNRLVMSGLNSMAIAGVRMIRLWWEEFLVWGVFRW